MTGSSNGEISEVANLDPDRAEEPIADGDATAGYPEGESGKAQEPEPEAGPNANPHRDQDTHRREGMRRPGSGTGWAWNRTIRDWTRIS